MNCTVLTFCVNFFICLELWFECCDFCFDLLWFGWFQFLIMDGWFLLGVVLIFLALCFFCSSLVSATSSYADDIAHI